MNVTSIGYYFYNATDDKWIAFGNNSSSISTYSVGDFVPGGVVFTPMLLFCTNAQQIETERLVGGKHQPRQNTPRSPPQGVVLSLPK